MSEFEEELRAALNRSSKENDSNTPDFILAGFLTACLDAFGASVRAREEWYGRKFSRGSLGGEKIEPEKCGARFFDYECVRAKGHPDGHLWESETLKPKEPAPKPGDERCTGRGFEVFRSGGWMLGTREGFFVRRKPSTDPRYVALCALESLDLDSDRLDKCAIEIRMHLRKPADFVKAEKGRNPHAAPRRKDYRRG